jgi:hypothetical protein
MISLFLLGLIHALSYLLVYKALSSRSLRSLLLHLQIISFHKIQNREPTGLCLREQHSRALPKQSSPPGVCGRKTPLPKNYEISKIRVFKMDVAKLDG